MCAHLLYRRSCTMHSAHSCTWCPFASPLPVPCSWWDAVLAKNLAPVLQRDIIHRQHDLESQAAAGAPVPMPKAFSACLAATKSTPVGTCHVPRATRRVATVANPWPTRPSPHLCLFPVCVCVCPPAVQRRPCPWTCRPSPSPRRRRLPPQLSRAAQK
ncbi:hypothetical protein EON67_06170 [archaeon]|nr:MAG: hypothetical protein EON67_06170 [archaeon]